MGMAMGTQGNTARERSKRELLDVELLRVADLVRKNHLATSQIRTALLGAPDEKQRPERPMRVGWLGEIQDVVEVMAEHLEDTAKALQDVYTQVSTHPPISEVSGRHE